MKTWNAINNTSSVLALGLMALLALMCPPAVAGDSNLSQPTNPVIAAGRICVSDAGVYCFERGSHHPAWAALEGRHTLELTYANDLLITAGSDGLTAIDPADGSGAWSRRDIGYAFPPIARDGILWLGTRDGHVLRLDATSGEESWQVDLPGWVYTPAVAGQRLVTGGSEGVLWALAAASGRILWSRPLPQELVFSPVAITDAAVAVATFDGRLRLIDSRTGQDVWVRRLETPAIRVTSDPRRIYALLMGGVVAALDPATGATAWRRRLAGTGTGLVRLDRYLMLSPGTGQMVALDPASGAVVGRADVGGEVIGTALPDSLIATRPPLTVQSLRFQEPSRNP